MITHRHHHRATLVALLLALAPVAGCSEKPVVPQNAGAPVGTIVESDPRAQAIGVKAVGPAADTSQTTPSSKSDLTKSQEANAMPLPGQANDHSTLSPKASQKAVPASR